MIDMQSGSAATPASSFGTRLRELRHAAGISQADLAATVGIDHTYLSKVETGADNPPSEATIARIAVQLCPDDGEQGGLRRLREELLLRAGKVPADVRAIICAHPESLALLRERYGERKASE